MVKDSEQLGDHEFESWLNHSSHVVIPLSIEHIHADLVLVCSRNKVKHVDLCHNQALRHLYKVELKRLSYSSTQEAVGPPLLTADASCNNLSRRSSWSSNSSIWSRDIRSGSSAVWFWSSSSSKWFFEIENRLQYQYWTKSPNLKVSKFT